MSFSYSFHYYSINHFLCHLPYFSYFILFFTVRSLFVVVFFPFPRLFRQMPISDFSSHWLIYTPFIVDSSTSDSKDVARSCFFLIRCWLTLYIWLDADQFYGCTWPARSNCLAPFLSMNFIDNHCSCLSKLIIALNTDVLCIREDYIYTLFFLSFYFFCCRLRLHLFRLSIVHILDLSVFLFFQNSFVFLTFFLFKHSLIFRLSSSVLSFLFFPSFSLNLFFYMILLLPLIYIYISVSFKILDPVICTSVHFSF